MSQNNAEKVNELLKISLRFDCVEMKGTTLCWNDISRTDSKFNVSVFEILKFIINLQMLTMNLNVSVSSTNRSDLHTSLF